MKTFILYNPKAGKGTSETEGKRLAALYEGEVRFMDITKIADYVSLLSPLTPEDNVVICGGDGTLNRFANAVKSIDVKCNILYYAIGTGNDFLKDLGKQVGEAPFRINEYLCDLPYVEIKGKKYLFLNGIGFGIDGYCCEVGDKCKAKAPEKPVNYTAIAIKGLLLHYKPRNATVVVDGKTYTYKKVWIAAAMKGRYYGGGMMTAPAQDRLAKDGEVTLVLFHGKGRLKTLMTFPTIFEGKHIEHTDMVAVHKGKDITVTYDAPAPLQVDGETELDVLTYHVTAGVGADAAVEQAAATV